MTASIPLDDWLDVLNREYLSGFVRDGGAAVRFAVTPEERRSALPEALGTLAGELGYVFVTVEALGSRVHMPQDIFFRLAEQLDWRLLARRVTLRLLADEQFSTAGIDPVTQPDIIAAVAEANGIEPASVRLRWRPVLQENVTKNANLARAFRIAMTQLCLLEREGPAWQGQPLLDWLTGAERRIGAVRPFQVHTPINRTNARHLIESLLYWVRFAGHAGTVVLLDNARVTVPRNPKDGQRFYTRAMTMDHYELLREFIDDLDRLAGALFVVMTDAAFVDDQALRGWGIYAALRTRVMDDVRDRNVVNPVAALVRLSSEAEGA